MRKHPVLQLLKHFENPLTFWLIVSCLSLIGAKIFEVTILHEPFFGIILIFLCAIAQVIPCGIGIIYLWQNYRQQQIKASIPLFIACASLFLIHHIDPVLADFYLYLPIRQPIVDRIISSTSPNLQSVSKENHWIVGDIRYSIVDRATQISFPRYTIGMGDGGAGFIYRSDNTDISISLDAYQKLRPTLPQLPILPFLKEVRRIKEHWFWQYDEW
ncbi:MAG: hypothetical protein WCO45_07310 [Pseudanabaena sp. ELA607]|jgi:hypothetical protein